MGEDVEGARGCKCGPRGCKRVREDARGCGGCKRMQEDARGCKRVVTLLDCASSIDNQFISIRKSISSCDFSLEIQLTITGRTANANHCDIIDSIIENCVLTDPS